MSDPFANLPRDHYGAILIDPPWNFQAWSKKGDGRSAQQHYDVMDVKMMVRLPVLDLAAKDCVLFCWSTWPHLKSALWLISAWGFTYKTCAFDWMKADPYCLFADDTTPDMGMGYWTRSNTEPCLLATRGKPKRVSADVRQGLIAPRREHSRKPDDIHGRIERLVAGPYLEIFARAPRSGWDTWGNQTDKFAEAAE
jgi:N6-adenosine-specific RNA methylase IME4